MGSLEELLAEYDRLGTAGSAHDFMLRQRRLEDWAAKARSVIAGLARNEAEPRSTTNEVAEPRKQASS